MDMHQLIEHDPGVGNWPWLISDGDGSHSKECDLVLHYADVELSSMSEIWNLYQHLRTSGAFRENAKEGGRVEPRDVAVRSFVRHIEGVVRRNPGIYTGPLCKHPARMIAWALLRQWSSADYTANTLNRSTS